MKQMDDALEIIKRHEGFSAEPYLCPGEVWTIGYGHTEGVSSHTLPIDEAYGETLLREDMRAAMADVDRLVNISLNQHQYGALVSFVFNIGAANFQRSTLLKKLNAGDYTGAADEFPRWVYAAGRHLRGLEKRRREERDLFLKPIQSEKFPPP